MSIEKETESLLEQLRLEMAKEPRFKIVDDDKAAQERAAETLAQLKAAKSGVEDL